MTTPLEAALSYLAQGWFPVPVPWGQKAPVCNGWSQLRLTAETVGAYFGSAPQNVGLLLGQLTDVDCDAPEAIAAATTFLPPTPRKHGRQSKPHSHWWYWREQAQPTVQFQDTDLTMLVELRGEGGHTLVPPSRHPSGELIIWESEGDPRLIDAGELERAVAHVAAVALLARHWPKEAGSRHRLALGLAGFLLRGGLDMALCARLIGSAARIAHDSEIGDRVRAVRSTAARLAAGKACIASIKRVLPDGAVLQGLLTRWLRLRVPHPRRTDLGNAERFVAQHGEDVRYVYAFRSWFVWNGQRWWRDPGDAVQQRAKATVRSIYAEAAHARNPDQRDRIVAWATRSESVERLKAMLELAKSEVAVLPDAFDRDPYLLNCPNGTLELRTATLRPHRREDLITKMTAAPYDPAAWHPLWDTFLDCVLPDPEVRDYLQRLAGYCLTGDTREEQWWLLFGPTLSGKTTWTASLEKTWGDYAIVLDFQTFAVQTIESRAPREDIARLNGPRLVVSSEVRQDMRLSEGLIKQFTGGDVLTAHRKYEHQFEFTPRCKLMVAANYRPRVRDDDAAIWRRIVEVPFTESITDPDPSIKAVLTDPTKAGPAILAWAADGAVAWFQDGLGLPAAIRASTVAYRAEMNPLAEFFQERCVFAADAKVPAGVLRGDYETWAKARGHRDVLSVQEFGRRLRDRGCTSGKLDRSTRAWRGVRLRIAEDDWEAETEETPETVVPYNFSSHKEGVEKFRQLSVSGVSSVSVPSRPAPLIDSDDPRNDLEADTTDTGTTMAPPRDLPLDIGAPPAP